jgi:hypothetical protein
MINYTDLRLYLLKHFKLENYQAEILIKKYKSIIDTSDSIEKVTNEIAKIEKLNGTKINQ